MNAETQTPAQVLDGGTELTAEVREWIERLGQSGVTDDFYLAGSAAISLHCGHRRVGTLDLMSPVHRLASAARRDLLGQLRDLDQDLRVETARDGYLSLRAGNGAGIRFFYYPYPLVAAVEEWRGMEVASRMDLILMKLAAIISRGTKRDFVDLYLLVEGGDLTPALQLASSKFGHVLDFPLQAFKGLSDRTRAAGDSMPPLSREVDWSEIERWLDTGAREAARQHVGLVNAE